MESQFETLLKSLQPSQGLFELASELFQELWDQRDQLSKQQSKSMTAEVSQIDRKIVQLMDRLVETDSDSVIRAYEKRIGALEIERAALREKIANCGKPLRHYNETFEHAITFLSSPWKIWENGSIEYRHTVLKLAFDDHLAYSKEDGFRTSEISLPFKALGDIYRGKKEMVHPGRFELPTP